MIQPWEEALRDVPAFRDFAGLSHIPSESSILRFRHLLERHKLADQILATVNALLQAKPCTRAHRGQQAEDGNDCLRQKQTLGTEARTTATGRLLANANDR